MCGGMNVLCKWAMWDHDMFLLHLSVRELFFMSTEFLRGVYCCCCCVFVVVVFFNMRDMKRLICNISRCSCPLVLKCTVVSFVLEEQTRICTNK